MVLAMSHLTTVTQTYYNFDLLVTKCDHGYQVKVVNSPDGNVSSTIDSSLLDSLELNSFLSSLRNSSNRYIINNQSELKAAKTIGSALFEAVFKDDIYACLRVSIKESYQNNAGLRIRLRFSDVPELMKWPWEYLYNSKEGNFLALSRYTPIVRYLELPGRFRNLNTSHPLNILAVVSNPLKDFDAEKEWEILEEALQDLTESEKVVCERLERPTLDRLRQALRQKDFHIFHFIGHGNFDEVQQEGVLLFEDDSQQEHYVYSSQLGPIFHDENELQLAILNACKGAAFSDDNLFSGLGQSLIQNQVPTVVAMQHDISHISALDFTREFYTALIKNRFSVEAALTEARKSIYTHRNLEWGIPALYSRATDGFATQIRGETILQDINVNQYKEQIATLLLEGSIKDFNSEVREHIKFVLARLLNLEPDQIRILEVSRGSVKLVLKLPTQAVQLLKEAYNNGNKSLKELGVLDVVVHSEESPSSIPPHGNHYLPATASSQEQTEDTTSEGINDTTLNSYDQTVVDRKNTHNPDNSQKVLIGHTKSVRAAHFGDNDRVIVTASEDGSIRIWDTLSGDTVETQDQWRIRDTSSASVQHTKIRSVAFGSDGYKLAYARDNIVGVWYRNSGERQILLELDAPVWSVAFSDKKGLLAAGTGGKHKSIVVWTWNKQQQTFIYHRNYEGHDSSIWSISFSPNEKHLASASRDQTVRVWNLEKEQFTTLSGHTAGVRSVDFDPEGQHVASASDDGTIRIWDIEFGIVVMSPLIGHRGPVRAVKYSHSGEIIATAGSDGTIRVWSARDGSLIHRIPGHKGNIWSVEFSSDDTFLVSAGSDHTARIWQIKT